MSVSKRNDPDKPSEDASTHPTPATYTNGLIATDSDLTIDITENVDNSI